MAIGDNFKGLPMADLIGGPLSAAAQAQYQLAETMLAFINAIGFEDKKTRTLDFDLTRPVDDGSGTIKKETVTINAPLLGLVPIPALLIESVTIDFSMEVKQSLSSKTTVGSETSTSATGKAGWGWWSASATITGKVSTNRENTRSTDNTAKYNVNVVARQQQPQEGMNKLMDLLSSAVDPIEVKSGKE